MLDRLYIENLAVIKSADVAFGPGLTVLTGETGAGKSVLIDAVNTVLGEKTSKNVIRTQADKAYISAVFSDLPEQLRTALSDGGFEPGEETVFSRELTASGRSVARIDGRPAPVQLLQAVGPELINIHGQHDNQVLLNESRHLGLLDAMGDYGALSEEYQHSYQDYRALQTRLDALEKGSADRERRLDLLSYQIHEIEQAGITPGEFQALSAERALIMNAEKISSAAEAVRDGLNGDDDRDGVCDALRAFSHQLSGLASCYAAAGEMAEKLDGALYSLQDVQYQLSDLLDSLSFDPGRQAAVEQRLAVFDQLRRKYGADETEILAYLQQCRAEYDSLSGGENDSQQLQAACQKLLQQTTALAERLSEARRANAVGFVKKTAEQLAFLNMPGVRMSARFERIPLGPKGVDRMVFLISANPGEEPKSISKIASGGELSRIMLAIKCVVAGSDPVQSLIFDEIDAGVSGSAADRIGQKLKQVSRGKQVICVTHLAQIAAFADTHLLIQKTLDEQSTQTTVTALDEQGRVEELARILGGAKITDATRENAKDLLKQARTLEKKAAF